jgi:serine/threonine protein kinase
VFQYFGGQEDHAHWADRLVRREAVRYRMGSVNATAPENAQALPPGTRLEEFEIEKVLGSGGFGISYLATDTSLGRKVVIKENLPVQFAFRETHSLTVAPRHKAGADAENFAWSLENFSKEAAMLASLDHPGIVKVLRSFRAYGTAFFVMPFVEGLPLDEIIRMRAEKGMPLDGKDITELLGHLLDALAYLHDRGIYHRDIKPGNILMTDGGMPVLIDFGSARQRLSERSMTVVESAGYTPFEQLQSRGNVGPWSDLYALGATMARAITGETPPKAMDRMRKDPFLPLAGREDLKAAYPLGLLSTIDKALRVDEEERWRDARAWKAAMVRSDADGITTIMDPPLPVPPDEVRRPGGRQEMTRAKTVGRGLWVAAVVVCLMVGMGWAWVASKEGEERSKQAILNGAQLTNGKIGDRRRLDIGSDEEIAVKYVPGGRFLMGSPSDELDRERDEGQVWVTLSSHYWMGETEVTQGQWVAVMGRNPSYFKDGDWKKLPVENVSWDDAQKFIKKLNAIHPPGTGWKWALPSEAQWERACRSGTTTATAFGNSLSSRQANFWGGSPYGGVVKGPYMKRASLVKSYQPNAYGLYDMHGNVWEWCVDAYGESLPGGTDPVVLTGKNRVLRGGGWVELGSHCRCANRFHLLPEYRYSNVGIRLAVVHVEK